MTSTICLLNVIHLIDLIVTSTWSTSTTSIICPFELVHLNDLLFDEWLDHDIKEVNNKEALKSSIFVVQMAAAPKNGVEFCQGSNCTIRSSLATSHNVSRRRATSPYFHQSEAWKLVTHRQTHTHFEILVQGSLQKHWTKRFWVNNFQTYFCGNLHRASTLWKGSS